MTAITGHGGRSLWPTIVASWGLACIVLLATGAGAILAGKFPDPDDAMRLLEAHDLLAGQSWWDVSQHRLSSGMMHWSRLVDLPIVGVMAPLRPIFGAMIAERAAMVIVPLCTLLVVMALVAHITRRLLDDDHARLALLIAPLSVALLNQLRPMRIDHHGWQIALALAALAAFLRPERDARTSALGGLAIAALLTISLEGLPIAAALLALVGLRWLIDPRTGAAFLGAIWSAAIGGLVLHIATRGPVMFTPACDAMSPVWLAMLATGAIGATVAVRMGGASLVRRVILCGATATASIAVLVAIDPACTAGPFARLDPVVRTLWYERINEGMPIWAQSRIWATMSIGLPLVGLVGSSIALRNAAPDRRADWAFMLTALVFAFALSLLVNRTAATANAFAVPGASLVLLALLSRARRIPGVLLRTLATAGALMTAAPGSAAIIFLGMPQDDIAAQSRVIAARTQRPTCAELDDIRAIAALPPGRVFAPVDSTPAILATSAHSAVASGHHRNATAMGDVMRAFSGSPTRAYRIVIRYGATYIAACPGLAETNLYDQLAPNGFWARLERGERFDWLVPVPIAGSPARAWRVIAPPQDQPRLDPSLNPLSSKPARP